MRVTLLAIAALVALLSATLLWHSTGVAQGVQTVAIYNFGFNPAEITIPVGTTVEWVNTASGIVHTSTSDTGVWDSGGLAPGSVGRFRFTFTQPGTYGYHCTPHPFMMGTIIVQGQALTPTPSPTATPTPTPTRIPTATPVPPTPTPEPTATPMPAAAPEPPGEPFPVVARVYLPAVFRAAP